MRWSTASFAIVGVVLSLGLASSAQAAPAMFEASFLMHAWGNDVTTGSSYPSNTSVFVPMPLGTKRTRSTVRCTPPGGLSDANPCPPVSQRGRPATGMGTISVATTGTGPAPIALPQSAFGVTTLGFWPIRSTVYSPGTHYTTYATFVNEAGSFFAYGGPATTHSFTFTVTGVGTVFIKRGPNAFGGAMGLLGKLGAREVLYASGTTFTGSMSWNMIRALGRGFGDPDRVFTNTGRFVNAAGTQTSTYTLTAWGTEWTTGSVTLYAKAGTFTTILHRAGYDTTTPSGVRNLQLVTPVLTQWIDSYGNQAPTGHIGILTIQVPEPSAVLMLVAGAGALVVLRKASRRG